MIKCTTQTLNEEISIIYLYLVLFVATHRRSLSEFFRISDRQTRSLYEDCNKGLGAIFKQSIATSAQCSVTSETDKFM